MFAKDTKKKDEYRKSKCTFNSIPLAILDYTLNSKNMYLGDTVGGTGSGQKHLDTSTTATDIRQWNQRLIWRWGLKYSNLMI